MAPLQSYQHKCSNLCPSIYKRPQGVNLFDLTPPGTHQLQGKDVPFMRVDNRFHPVMSPFIQSDV